MPNRKIRVPIGFAPPSGWTTPNVNVPVPMQKTDIEFYKDPANSTWSFTQVTITGTDSTQLTADPPGNSGNTIKVTDADTAAGTWGYQITVNVGGTPYTSPLVNVANDPAPRIVNDATEPGPGY